MEIKLSNRLKKVASFLPKGAIFADIGSDHAYLPCYVCLSDDTARAIAGEVKVGPLQSAKETVESLQLTHKVDVRLGNGLEVIQKKDGIEQIVIAGMGGSLINTILEKGQQQLQSVNRIIAQPNIDARTLRKCFGRLQFQITDEAILEENGHIYEIIVADRKADSYLPTLSEKELLFGPILLKERSTPFYDKWHQEKQKYDYILRQLKNAKYPDKNKTSEFEKERKWIEEVLSNVKRST
ncbi:tRNA (adenine(22)-N(1))-methyltransferase [Oceanobacillus halotolerans]|uniref:tRNA (adenine(22)-N(1))-methyltransferase n=1 Tax=Oceanobacillus halotolerans TaxID=2663380 RepID=UPI0013DCFDF6|nr:tRNA (adenine(22)-N(1))-methyltransferase TrmK [Oceanobacillus halotolerans]